MRNRSPSQHHHVVASWLGLLCSNYIHAAQDLSRRAYGANIHLENKFLESRFNTDAVNTNAIMTLITLGHVVARLSENFHQACLDLAVPVKWFCLLWLV